PRKRCLAEQSADPLPSMPEIHQSCRSRGRVQDPAEISPRGLRYSLRNRTRSPGCHDRLRPAAARWRLGGPPLEHITFDNQRARNTTLNRVLALGTNIDEYRPRFDDRLIGPIWR